MMTTLSIDLTCVNSEAYITIVDWLKLHGVPMKYPYTWMIFTAIKMDIICAVEFKKEFDL